MAARCVEEAEPGGVVLLDGDLQPDWQDPAGLVGGVARAGFRARCRAGRRHQAQLPGPRGAAPLVGQLELEAEALFGPRATWWAPVARQRSEIGPGLLVAVARLDVDARFAFRVDVPADREPAALLGQLAALSDDAAFPGYPYPLSAADRLGLLPRLGSARRSGRSSTARSVPLACPLR